LTHNNIVIKFWDCCVPLLRLYSNYNFCQSYVINVSRIQFCPTIQKPDVNLSERIDETLPQKCNKFVKGGEKGLHRVLVKSHSASLGVFDPNKIHLNLH